MKNLELFEKYVSFFDYVHFLMNENNKKVVLLDTNFFMLPFVKNVDVISELESLFGLNKFLLLTLDSVVFELRSISKSGNGSGKFKKEAKLAISFLDNLLKKKKLSLFSLVNDKEINNLSCLNDKESYVDDHLIDIARLIFESDILKNKESFKKLFYIFTSDSKLRKKLKNFNINIVFLRQNKYFYLD